MRFWVSRRIGPLSIGVSFGPGDFRRYRSAPRQAIRGDHVYVVEGNGAVKIGVTSDLRSRLSQLQTGSPHPLHMAYSTQIWGNAYAVEAEAHAMLDRHRVSGEWFAVPADVAVAAVSGAAFRLCQAVQPTAAEAPNWLKRISLMFLIFLPTWLAIAHNQPLIAIPAFFFASVLLIFGLMRAGAASNRSVADFIRWCGALTLSTLSSAAAGAFVGAVWR